MKFIEKALSNQVKIVFFPKENCLTTALTAFVNFGIRFEDEKTQGLSTFLANILLRGSQKYPDELSLGETLDNLGAYFNVEIQKEYSAFYLKVADDKVVRAADFLAQLLTQPIFSLAEIEREKKLNQADFASRTKNASLIALDSLSKLVYQNHPLSFSGIATPNFLDTLKRDELMNLHQKYYAGANLTLAVVGEEETFQEKLAEIEKIFSVIPQGKKNSFIPFDKTNLQPQTNLFDFESDQIYGAIGYPGYERNHPLRRVLELIETILGKGRANRRLLPLYLNRTPASYVIVSNQFFSDLGFFLIQTAAPAVNIKLAYQKIIEEIEKLKTEEIKKEELERAKNIYLGSLLIQLGEPIETGFFYGLQYLFNQGKVASLKEIETQIEKITAQDIQEVTKEVFDQNKLFVSLVGKEVTKIR